MIREAFGHLWNHDEAFQEEVMAHPLMHLHRHALTFAVFHELAHALHRHPSDELPLTVPRGTSNRTYSLRVHRALRREVDRNVGQAKGELMYEWIRQHLVEYEADRWALRCADTYYRAYLDLGVTRHRGRIMYGLLAVFGLIHFDSGLVADSNTSLKSAVSDTGLLRFHMLYRYLLEGLKWPEAELVDMNEYWVNVNVDFYTMLNVVDHLYTKFKHKNGTPGAIRGREWRVLHQLIHLFATEHKSAWQ